MAPAATASKNGSMGWAIFTSPTPSKPPIGSTNPVAIETRKASHLGKPSRISGNATASPSGIFCKPIPIAMLRPLEISPSPNPTPTAIPSGKLCTVIARMNIHTFLISGRLISNNPFFEPVSGMELAIKFVFGKHLSIRSRKIPPARIPTRTIPAPRAPPPAFSMAGITRLKEVAASIMPAAVPSSASISFLEMFRAKKIGRVPTLVNSPDVKLARKPTKIILYCERYCTIPFPPIKTY